MTTLAHSAATSFRKRAEPSPPRDGSDRVGRLDQPIECHAADLPAGPAEVAAEAAGVSAFRLRHDATVCLSQSDPACLMVK